MEVRVTAPVLPVMKASVRAKVEGGNREARIA
jgi:hypothetical protein